MTKLEKQLTAENVFLRKQIAGIAEDFIPTNESENALALEEIKEAIGELCVFNCSPQVEALQALVETTLKFVNLSKDITDEKVRHLAAVGMNPTKFEMIKAVRKYKETIK